MAAALCLLLPAAGQAQSARELADLSLDALLDMEVSGTSRFPTRRSESAAAVTVITRDQIRALGHHTLAEALRSVRGVMIATDRTYDYLGVRGFYASGDYNTRVLLLVDGNRINDSLYDQAFVGSEFPLDIGEIERIEFVPGQGSAVYGANALFGVINVITRSPREATGGHAAVALGSQGERIVRAGWQRASTDGGWRLALSRSLKDGEALADATPGAPPDRQPGIDAERRTALHARWDQGPWTASLLYADRDKLVPLAPGLHFGDTRNRYRDTLLQASVQNEQRLGASEQLTTRVHAGEYRFLGNYLIDYPPLTHNRDVGRGRWWGLESRITSTRWAGHRLVAGVEWQNTTELLQQNFDVAPSTDSYLDDRRSGRRSAVFGEDQVRLSDQWTLHVGVRIDQVRHTGHATSPRLALAWRPDAAWSLKAVQGRSFRAPNAYEAFYESDTPAGYVRNPDLQPERVRGNELIVDWLPAPNWRVSTSLYRNRGTGLLILGYDREADRYRFNNAGSFAARGAEFELEHAVGAWHWRLNASLNQDRSGAPEAAAYPRRMLKGTLVMPLAGDWRLGVEGAALSRRASAPGSALANLTLSGPLPRVGATLQLSVRNALDRVLQDPGADAERQPVVPQPRRTVRLALEWPVGR